VWACRPPPRSSSTPHHLLAHSLLRVPGLQVEGLRAHHAARRGRPLRERVNARERGLTLRATGLPVYSEQHGVAVCRPPPTTASRPQRGTSTPPWRARYTFCGSGGAAPAFQHTCDLGAAGRAGALPVLLLGESGTGKELLAQAIHTASPARPGTVCGGNCGAGSDELLSAELFGYAAGAFTGP